ncbi:MAG: lysozyme inhibitor LprI family protein [Pseudomonadota bacterium]
MSVRRALNDLTFAWLIINLLVPLSAFAADIEEGPPLSGAYVTAFPTETMEGLQVPGRTVSFAEHRHIRISGDITTGDAARLADLLGTTDPFDRIVISLSSPGGDYRAGLALADVIYRSKATTFVGRGDTCLSACGLAFLGGTEEVIRNVLERPSRYVHTQARLGFHAPFNTTYPTLPTFNEQTTRFIADLFYAQAREAIRLLQARITPLSLRPDFVFDMLGKGPEEFLFIDRYREASQNQITVVTDVLSQTRQMGAMGAKLACGYLIETAISPAEGFGDVISSGNWTDIADPFVLTNAASFPTDVSVLDADQAQVTFLVNTLIAGRGPFTCTISNAPDGIWRGDLSGDIPTVPGRMGGLMNLTQSGPVPLNHFTTLGSYLPWSVMGASDLRLTGDEDTLYESVPADLRQSDGPSFDCGGDLDPGAEIICRFPLLSRADATMVALFLAKRDAGVPDVRESQRAWLRERDALCRPEFTNQDDEFELTLAGYCLLESTLSRVAALSRL